MPFSGISATLLLLFAGSKFGQTSGEVRGEHCPKFGEPVIREVFGEYSGEVRAKFGCRGSYSGEYWGVFGIAKLVRTSEE